MCRHDNTVCNQNIKQERDKQVKTGKADLLKVYLTFMPALLMAMNEI